MSISEVREGTPKGSLSAVTTLAELDEIVRICTEVGAFSFDVETRGVVDRHPDVLALIEDEWKQRLSSLKTTNTDVLARSKAAIVERWTKELAVDPLRNEVFWLGIATEGHSWAIPMGHRHGTILAPEEVGDGSTTPPPGYRKILANGKESMAKSRYYIPAEFSAPPMQLSKSDVFATLSPLFTGSLIKVGHNVKFDARSIRKYLGGDLPTRPYMDTMVMQHIANENLREYSLTSLIDHNFHHDAYHRDGKLGSVIDLVSYEKAVRYVHLDVRWTWLLYKTLAKRITSKAGLSNALEQDMETLYVLMHMEDAGIPVAKREMKRLGKDLDLRMRDTLLDMAQYAPAGFNPDSVVSKRQLLFGTKKEGGLALKPTKKTPKGQASVDDEVLDALKDKHPIIPLLLEWQEIKKLKSTYVDGLLPKLVHERLHPSFHLHRAATGRLSSCVSGDTLLTTSRGTFRFDEYLPELGDLVPTHTGTWKPVLRKVYKGVQPMVSVHLYNGSVLKCTEEHKILTPNGWTPVRDLAVGMEVYSHVGVKEVYGGLTQRQGSTDVVFGGSRQAHGYADCPDSGHHISQRPVHCDSARRRGTSESGKGSSILTLQVGGEEPNVGENWGGPSQLHRPGGRWEWLFDEEGRWEVRPRTPICVRSGVGHSGVASVVGRASHQRGQKGQSLGQPGVGYSLGAWGATSETSKVRAVVPLGEMGVWDIEVADDHSYVTHGFVNHNSHPNLQNIPRDSSVRGLFVAPQGYSLLVFDYDQIELRVMCMYSKDPKMSEFFINEADIHAGAAALCLNKSVDDITPEERQLGKGVNFLTAYGGGPQKLARVTGITEDHARYVIQSYYKQFSGISRWKSDEIIKARRRGYVTSLSGRRRRLPDLTSSNDELRSRAERQAINAIIQGSAADICKIAMIDTHEAFQGTGAHLLVQVHDELIAACPEDKVDEIIPIMMEAMGHGRIIEGIPLKVSGHAAYSWAEGKGK